jgi:hypothetical protein
VRLRYVGAQPTTFITLGVEVEPGDEFEVPDDAAHGLLARADIEEVAAPSTPRRKAAKASAPDPSGTTPDPDVTEEVSHGVPDDH